MKKKLLVLAGAVALGGAGLVMAGSSVHPADARRTASPPAPAAAPAPEIAAGPPSTTFQRIAKAESPGVVNVTTSKVVEGESVPEGFQEFFRGFPGVEVAPRGERRTRMGEGSGFVIDKDGWILTNRHVVDDADKVWVTTSNGRRYAARVVGRDARTDVAVLKIAPREPLTILPLGDSSQVEPGEWVMAVGNPFGLGGNSVSVGVVSFKGRPMDLSEHGTPIEMVQTDAAINPGNSGGPLIDAGGRVIGINTLIVTQGVGQSSGVGFAVPINVAKAELAQLKEKGHVTRGWLGIQIQALDEDLSSSLGLRGTDGALVSDVRPGGPADKAGMKPGDVITRVNGTAVHTSADVSEIVSSLAPGEKAKLDVVRDGREKTLDASVGTFPEGREEASAGTGGERGRLGLSLRPLDDASAAHLDLPRGMDGLVVSEVEPGSPAETAGLRPGDVIVGVDGREVSSRGDFEKAVDGRQPVRVRVYRGGGYLFLVLKPEDAPAQ